MTGQAASPHARQRRRTTGIALLHEQDRPAVEAHLLRLSPEDRALRFGGVVDDGTLVSVMRSLPLAGSLGLFLDVLQASLDASYAGGARQLTAHYTWANRPMACMMRRIPKAVCSFGPEVVARVGLERWADEMHASNRLIEPAV